MQGDEVSVKFTVSGKVQGVFFRASTAREATRLGLKGYAINLPDGRVEVLAVGPAGAVEQLRLWLQRGPPAARVAAVESRSASPAASAGLQGFSTG